MRVLLADDHQILRDGIRRGLESAGEDVVGEADNGEEAVALAIETRPDIVLMDLSMPVLDGVGAARRMLGSAVAMGPVASAWASSCAKGARSVRTGLMPRAAAASSSALGVRPNSLARLASAPKANSRRSVATVSVPAGRVTSRCNAVLPRTSIAFGSAPASSSDATISASPRWAAWCNAFRPAKAGRGSVASRSAPATNRARTRARSPQAAASTSERGNGAWRGQLAWAVC